MYVSEPGSPFAAHIFFLQNPHLWDLNYNPSSLAADGSVVWPQALPAPPEYQGHCLVCQGAGFPLAGCAAGANGPQKAVGCVSGDLPPVLLQGLGLDKPVLAGSRQSLSRDSSHLIASLLLIPLLQCSFSCLELTLQPSTWPVSSPGSSRHHEGCFWSSCLHPALLCSPKATT